MDTFRAATRRKHRDNRDILLSGEPAKLRTLFTLRQDMEAISEPLPPEPFWNGQESAGDVPWDHILIMDADANHAEALAEALTLVGFQVFVIRAGEAVIAAIKRGGFGLVIIVPHSPTWWRSDLKTLCEAIRDAGERPEIMCVLPWPAKGPGDRIFGDELNVVVLHEE
jgi:hypothetical protein